MVTTLLTAGFESKSIPKLALERILGILSESGASRGYCVGFGKSYFHDKFGFGLGNG